jgi:phosphatidylserine/phosphatidylglycerophosphate/cardiolipin synthase-like enzyme
VSRVIAKNTRAASRHVRDALQTVFASLLLDPPPRLWLVSAWVTDAAVLDNRAGEVSALVPTWPEREVVLSEVLAELAVRGTRMVIATNNHPANEGFVHAMRSATVLTGRDDAVRLDRRTAVEFTEESLLHRKRLVTDEVSLMGSMNFTYSGYERNAEDLRIDVEPSEVAARVNELQQLYPLPLDVT